MISLNQVIWIDQDLVILDQTACLILGGSRPSVSDLPRLPWVRQGRGCCGNLWSDFSLHPELRPLVVQVKVRGILRRFLLAPILSIFGFG